MSKNAAIHDTESDENIFLQGAIRRWVLDRDVTLVVSYWARRSHRQSLGRLVNH
jgi:hypothetical protein